MRTLRTPQAEQVRLGKVYLHDGKLYRVGLLNECRARLDPLWRKKRVIHDRFAMTYTEIRSTPPSLNVAPTIQLPPVLVR